MKIKIENLYNLQNACIKKFEIEDGDDLRGIGSVERAIKLWLKKITDNEKQQAEIYEIVYKYKFDLDWNRTCDALQKAGYEVI